MNKRLLLLTFPSLLTACLEPNRMGLGADDESGSGSADAPQGESDNDEPDEPDAESSESGTDEPESDESGESGEPEPHPNCDLETHECISNVPANWHGPVARIAADHPLGCHGDYATPGTQQYSGIFANPADCTCECGSTFGGECESELAVEFYPVSPFFGDILNDDGCETMVDEIFITDTASPYPTNNAVDEHDARMQAHPPVVTTPSQCAVVSSMAELDEPITHDVVQTCEPSAPIVGCDEETICVPKTEAPFDGGACIWQQGDQPCPGGTDFVDRHVVDSGVVDTRTCSACECGPGTGESCEDAVYNVWRVGDYAVTLPADGECHLAELGTSPRWTALNYQSGSPSGGSCEHLGGEPEGGVAPEAQITFCCA